MILIILVGVGIFAPTTKAQAADEPKGTCTVMVDSGSGAVPSKTTTTYPECKKLGGSWEANSPTTNENQSEFEKWAINESCGIIGDSSLKGCIKAFFYYVVYTPSAIILSISAKFFNALISIALSSTLFSDSDFIPTAWAVVRDLSNIFFILILLYIAIQIILDMGHDAKKMIAKVLVIALLINFSMFFTKVVIDSSNVLALIFYNKLDVTYTNAKGETVARPYDGATGAGEKDLSGSMYNGFDITSKLTPTFWDQTRGKGVLANGKQIAMEDEVPVGTMVGIMLVAATIMLFAAYAFFISGLAFVARLIELFVLIIFSPFAFMSSTVPLLSRVEDLGWDSWLKRLLKAAFMAPIFMFFMYLIFLLLDANLFGSLVSNKKDWIQTILGVAIPGMLILILLLQATEFAKKGAGKIGEGVMNFAKLAGGLALGTAAFGTAALGRKTLGATAKYVQNEGARKKDLKFTDLTTTARQDWAKPWKYPSIAGKAISGAVKFVPAVAATGLHAVGIGKKLKEADEGYGHKTHATHILDAKMQSEFGHQYGKDAKYKDLTEHEQEIVKKEIEKDEMAKFQYGKQFKDLEAPEAKIVQDQYNEGKRAIDNGHGKTIGIGATPADAVNGEGRPVAGGVKFKSDYFVDMSKTNAAVGEFVQALRKGSYDIRNLPDMSAKTKGFPKLGVATIALVAAGVRLGIKKGVGVEHYGTPQRNVFDDIKNTIGEALKNVKINVGGGGHETKNDHSKEVKSVGH